jgi:hypothetical protein
MQETMVGAVVAVSEGRYRPNPAIPPRAVLRRWILRIALNQLSHHQSRAHRRHEVPSGAPGDGYDADAKLIGMPGKLDCKGSNVQAMIDAGQIEQVRAYCMHDVVQTAALFLRVQLLRGKLAPASYVAAAEHLLATIAREPRLAPMLPHIDRDRLLTTGGAAELVPTGRAA